MKKVLLPFFLILIICFSFFLIGCEETPENTDYIVLGPKNINFKYIGATEQLNVKMVGVNEDEKLYWETSNPKVATCQNGVVTSVGYGVCVIKVTTEGGISSSCVVSVKDPDPMVVLSETEVILSSVGETYQLNVKNSEGYVLYDGVKWFSTDRQVFVCSNGLIEARSPGIALLTVETDSGAKDACVVRILDEGEVALGMSQDSLILQSAGETGTLFATVYGKTDKAVEWYSTDESVVKVEGGVVTAVGNGVCAVTASVDGSVPTACYVIVGESPNINGLPENIVDFEMANLGLSVYTLDRVTGEILSVYMPLSYSTSYVMFDKDTMEIYPEVECVKIYDKDGRDGKNYIYVGQELYRESGEFCISDYVTIKDVGYAEKFKFSFEEFHVALESGLLRYFKLYSQLITKR